MSNTRFLSVPVQQPSQAQPAQPVQQPAQADIATWSQSSVVRRLQNKTSQTTRLVSKQEFKASNPGLKGNALTAAYNALLRKHGKEGAAAARYDQDRRGLLFSGVRETKRTVWYGYLKPEAVKDTQSKSKAKPTASTMMEAMRGMDPAELSKFLSEITSK